MTNPTFANNPPLPPLYLGLPQWQHPRWASSWFEQRVSGAQQLGQYAARLSSVEGNTTFYALPDAATCDRWHQAVPDTFRFCFKLHQETSHSPRLTADNPTLASQLVLMQRFGPQLGCLMLQLPAAFSVARLSELRAFLTAWPTQIPLAVEVRNPQFFAKQAAEQQLNRLLMEFSVSRVMLDSRALFASQTNDAAMLDAKGKKPRLPVNVIATNQQPVVRFIGADEDAINERCLLPWVHKCQQWREEGRSPYVFLHRADNQYAPWLGQLFVDLYNRHYPATPLPGLRLPAQPDQASLF